jgi:predicted dehydrogenase
MRKLRWGVLSTARIGTVKVIPAMQQGEYTSVVAIASRDESRAKDAAARLGIARAYGSYEELLGDSEIDVIYNPLPNHLHVPWSIRAIEHGKHVLCEKPVALDAAEALTLAAAAARTGRRAQEAFMVATHPQWVRAVELCRSGALGEVRACLGAFSYDNDDPHNIRNVPAWGGGGLLDIGCYLVLTARMMFGEEPRRALGVTRRDQATGVDTLCTLMLEFPSGEAAGVCGTRHVPWQKIQVFGTRARLEIDIPFNAPNDRPCRLTLDDGRDTFGSGATTIDVAICDQYRIQGDLFSRSILEDTPQPFPLEQSILNMRVIDAVARSARTGRWEDVT